jgi:hypothetical protein
MSGCNPSHQQQQQLRLPFLHHRNGTIMGRTRKRASQPPSPTNSCVESCSNEMMLLQPSDGKKHKPTIGADKENDAETSSSTSQVRRRSRSFPRTKERWLVYRYAMLSCLLGLYRRVLSRSRRIDVMEPLLSATSIIIRRYPSCSPWCVRVMPDDN